MFWYKGFLKRTSPKKDVGSASQLIKISVDRLGWHKKFHKKSNKEVRCVERAIAWAKRKVASAIIEC